MCRGVVVTKKIHDGESFDNRWSHPLIGQRDPVEDVLVDTSVKRGGKGAGINRDSSLSQMN